VLLEQERLAPVEGIAGAVGGELKMMASGIDDSESPPLATLRIVGPALQPPSPVHLRAERQATGDISISWTRRSRSGWTWTSGADTPLGEESEAYELVLSAAGFERRIELFLPNYIYTNAQQALDGLEGPFLMRVCQLGTHARSRSTSISVN
jgi:hypothetical protein